MSLKERLFERYIRKHPQKQSGFPDWEKVRNICILAEAATIVYAVFVFFG